MSELAIFKGKSLPAHIRKLGPDATTRALTGGGGGGLRISISGSVWRLLNNGQEVAVREERNLNVVIVDASEHVGRIYYEGTYTEGVSVPPTCWSSDGIKPDASVEEPMSDKCDTCPMNIKGSGVGNSKACRYFRRLAVVLENDLDGDVYQLQLPATSLFGEGEAGTRQPGQRHRTHCRRTATPRQHRRDGNQRRAGQRQPIGQAGLPDVEPAQCRHPGPHQQRHPHAFKVTTAENAYPTAVLRD